MSKKRFWQIMGESGHCYFFWMQLATVNVLAASKNSEKPVDTRTVDSTAITRIWQSLSLVCPLRYHVTFAFIPSILKHLLVS